MIKQCQLVRHTLPSVLFLRLLSNYNSLDLGFILISQIWSHKWVRFEFYPETQNFGHIRKDSSQIFVSFTVLKTWLRIFAILKDVHSVFCNSVQSSFGSHLSYINYSTPKGQQTRTSRLNSYDGEKSWSFRVFAIA